MKITKALGLVLAVTTATLATAQADFLQYTLITDSSFDNEEAVDDDSFYDLRYPRFSGGANAAQLNAVVENILAGASCDSTGDRHVNVKVNFLSDAYLSLQHASAVMCIDDIHERKRKGVLNFDLRTGKQFEIATKFDPAKTSELFARVNDEINRHMAEHTPDDVTCESAEWQDAYLTRDGVVFGYELWSDYFPCYGSTVISYADMAEYWLGELPNPEENRALDVKKSD